jgi:hypothetical protein
LRILVEDPQKYEDFPLAENYVLFATGDGSNEDRVCQGFTHQFDGHKIYLVSFKSPLPRREVGLASLASVRTYVDRFRVNRLVWTCDKEHLVQASWIDQVDRKLAGMGMSSRTLSKWGDAAKFEVTLGPKSAVLWCAVTGTTVRLEENLSQLIELELREKVGSDKKEIFAILKARNLKMQDLIKGASKNNLRQAMPSLFAVFEDIERSHTTDERPI